MFLFEDKEILISFSFFVIIVCNINYVSVSIRLENYSVKLILNVIILNNH